MSTTLVIGGMLYTLQNTAPTSGYALTVNTTTRAIDLSKRRDHFVVTFYASAGTNVVISNIGAGPSGVSANVNHAIDLRRSTKFRIQAVVNVNAAGGGTLRLQYSSDNSSWSDAEASGTGADISITGTGHVVGAWGTLASGANIQTCYLRTAGYGGNGTDDPGFRLIAAEFTEE